jgi:hypothetical protein
MSHTVGDTISFAISMTNCLHWTSEEDTTERCGIIIETDCEVDFEAPVYASQAMETTAGKEALPYTAAFDVDQTGLGTRSSSRTRTGGMRLGLDKESECRDRCG